MAYWPLLVTLVCALLGAIGQLFLKLGSARVSTSLLSWIGNPPLLAGFAAYAIAAFGFIIALKYSELSLLYPLIATSYIWVGLFAVLFLAERLSGLNWLGLAMIVVGVALATLR